MRSRQIKRMIVRILFAGEIVLFGWLYLVGPQGLQVVRRMHDENSALALSSLSLKHEVATLQEDLDEWQVSSFKKEKVAREKLQLAHEEDLIYRID